MKRFLFKFLAWLLFFFMSLPVFFHLAARGREKLDAASLAERGHFSQVDGVSLFYQVAGPESGPVVLFIGGTGGWSETWKYYLAFFASKGFRAIAVDLPPFGLTSELPKPDYSAAAQALLLSKFLDNLQISKFILVGLSIGGRATMALALRETPRLHGLVLIDIALGMAKEEKPKSPWFAPVLNWRPLRVAMAEAGTYPPLTRLLLEQNVVDKTKITNKILDAFVEPFSVKGASGRIADWVGNLFLPADEDLATGRGFEILTLPVLILWGENDPITPLWQAERLTKWLKSAQLITFPGVGHFPQIEAPSLVEEKVFNYLNSRR